MSYISLGSEPGPASLTSGAERETGLSRATVSGAAHVFVAADPEMEASVRRRLLGLPIREAFPEPEFAAILDMYDFARCWGLRVTLDAVSSSGELGTITLTPDP
jgi:hypothetical protein